MIALVNAQAPPSAPELERALLGACLLELMHPKVFYIPAHACIWRAISGLYGSRSPVDLLTVTIELKRRGDLELAGGPFNLSQLTNSVASVANVVYHAHLILQAFIGREAIRIGSHMIEEGHNPGTDVFDLLSGAASEIRLLNEFGVKQARSMAEIMPEVVDNNSPDRGIKFGYEAIDKKIRLEPGTVTIIGARPAMGKTAFMLSSAWRQAQNGHRPYVMELEMKDRNLAMRLACGETRIPLWKAKRRLMDQHDTERMARWNIDNGDNLGKLLVDEAASLKVSALAARLDRAKRRNGVDMVWIDYIGLLQPSEKQSMGYNRMTAISNELRVLAKEMDLPFAVLAQLSRPEKGKTVRPPALTDLRDSGEIEQDAEAVCFLHRPKYYDTGADDTVQFIIAKNRDGEDGFAEMDFDGAGVRMVDKSSMPMSPTNATNPDNHISSTDVAPF
jgi:replicative DNA helicase